MLRAIKNKIISKVASRHVAGPEIENALQVCRWAGKAGFASIISPWRGANESAGNMFERYKLNLTALHNENINGYLSIKLDALGYDFNLFKDLLELGRMYDIRVHLDSLDPESAPVTFQFLERAAEFNNILGCTLPSRWQRSLEDADRAVDLGLFVRIVKGQWEDTGSGNPDCKKNYLAIAGKLAGRAKHVGIATHDVLLARQALKRLAFTTTHSEMEQFFSLPLNGAGIAKKMGCPYRIYVAYGQPGVPYNVKFALTRPSIAAWMAADFAFRLKKPWTNQAGRT